MIRLIFPKTHGIVFPLLEACSVPYGLHNTGDMVMKIVVDGLTRSFGRTLALDHISFEIPDGTVYGFIGTNGAGKTTALRIMAGLDRPDCGGVRYDSLSAVDYPERIPGVAGFMPDTLMDAKDLLVWEYLDFFARAYGLRGKAKADALARVSEYTSLDGLSDRPLSGLSKGMKQQVSLARVLIHDPPVLLLDEPAAGLDPRARVLLQESLGRLAATGKTVLISSHILCELEEMIGGVVIIEHGRLSYAGSLDNAVSRAGAAGCSVLLSLRGKAEEYLEELRRFPFVAAVRPTGARQLLLTLGGEEEFGGQMAELFRAGLPITAMSRPDLSLEGVFMDNTTGEVQ